jgi:hypothetical protein
MRNAVTLGVSQNCLDTIPRDFKLFGDFGGAQAMVEVVDNSANRHPRAAQDRHAAQYAGLGLD